MPLSNRNAVLRPRMTASQRTDDGGYPAVHRPGTRRDLVASVYDRLRRDVGVVQRQVRLRRDTAGVARAVRTHLRLPSLPRMGGQCWAIMMVKDEADIIASTVRHTFRQGVDGVLVVDNRSSDRTRDVLDRLAAELPVFVGDDSYVGYEQAVKMTILADEVRRRGARWVVPIDADEYWFGEARTLRDVLAKSRAPIRVARIFNVFPADYEAGSWKVDTRPHPRHKVTYRPTRASALEMGNHDVYRTGRVEAGVSIVHVPWRSLAQFTRKSRNGAAALQQSSLGDWAGSHWRRLGAASDRELAVAWRRIVDEEDLPGTVWQPRGRTVPFDFDSLAAWREVARILNRAKQAPSS